MKWWIGLLLLATSDIAVGDYGTYCHSGDAVIKRNDSVEWSVEPYCEQDSVQDTASYQTQDVNFGTEYQTVNLSSDEYHTKFCCNANYTTQIPRNTSVEELDAKARQYYEAAERVLSRFNCRDFYPYFSCTPCQYAYRSWVCSIMFPRKCADIPAINVHGHTQKVCKDVCYEVVRKCPVELEFHCPTDNTYGDWGVVGDWSEATAGPFRGRCNPMELNIDAATSRVISYISAVILTLVVILL